VGRRHLLGQPGELIVLSLEDLGGDPPLPLAGIGHERPDAGGGVVQRLGELVGDGQDLAAGAAVDGEVEELHLAAVTAREGVGEAEDVGDRRAAPAVDRLVGVADGHHGVAAAEQSRQHDRLRGRGVLVLVEHDDPEPLALGGADLGLLVGQPGGERDLVREVHQPQVGLHPPVGLDELQQLLAPLDGVERLLDRLQPGLAGLAGQLLVPGPLEPAAHLGVVGAHLGGLAQVLVEGAVEGEQPLDDGRRVVGEQDDLARVPVDGARTELVARRVSDDAGVGLVADPQAVVGEQPGGVGVVGGDGRLEDLAVLVLLQHAGHLERAPDLGAQLCGRLGGERQAEHLVGPDLAGDDEVDDPRRHERRLAGAGAGDDHDRLEGRGDGLPLLGRRGVALPHDRLQLLGRADLARGHAVTAPAPLIGQRLR